MVAAWTHARLVVCPHLSSAPRPCASVTTSSNLKGGLAITIEPPFYLITDF